MPSYYRSSWRTYEDFSYGSPNFQIQGGSRYNYKEQFQQPSDEELFYALLNEMKEDNDACEDKMRIWSFRLSPVLVTTMKDGPR